MNAISFACQVALDLCLECDVLHCGESQIPVFEVSTTWQHGGGKPAIAWKSTWGSVELANAYLRGIRAALPGAVRIPDIISTANGEWAFSTTLTLITRVNDPNPVYASTPF